MSATQCPAKPSPDFPLFAHQNGQWAKKVRGKLCYFGPWSDPESALARYQEQMSSVEQTKRSKTRRSSQKPLPPTKGFPLFAHQNGQWAKTINRKTYYFGKWDEPDRALRAFLRRKDDLYAGRKPKDAEKAGCTLGQICRAFLSAKRSLVASGELSRHTTIGYERESDRLLGYFGENRVVETLTPRDFESYRNAMTDIGLNSKNRAWKSKPLGPTALGNAIAFTRSVLKYAYEQDLIRSPIKYGQGFKRPSPRVLRQARNKKGKRMFEAAEIRAMIDNATRPLKAMILLGINCGMGNTDCARLPVSAVDLDRKWLDFPRPKTGVLRWSPLWDETCEAIRHWLKRRPEPKYQEDSDLLFLTQKEGQSWENKGGYDSLGHATSKLIRSLRFDRPGLSFYSLRHTFLTIAEGCRDQKAVEFIMGHAPDALDMSARYREEFSQERLLYITNYVHDWLFAEAKSPADTIAVPVALALPTCSTVGA